MADIELRIEDFDTSCRELFIDRGVQISDGFGAVIEIRQKGI